MIFRLLDSNSDWVLGQGLSSFATAERAIELNIQTRLLSWVNNCFFDLPAGIDWDRRLDKGQRGLLLTDLRALLLQSEDVVGVTAVSYNFDERTRRINVTYNITTVYSPTFQRTVSAAVGGLPA